LEKEKIDKTPGLVALTSNWLRFSTRQERERLLGTLGDRWHAEHQKA
jgi:hypothetical protein